MSSCLMRAGADGGGALQQLAPSPQTLPPHLLASSHRAQHRVYDGARLRALLRSYLKLNSGEAFYPTLVEVVEELRAELGVA